MDFRRVRLSFVVTLATQKRGEGDASASGRQFDPTDVVIHDYLEVFDESDPISVLRYPIASLLPGAAAFLTSLSSRMPLSYLASHADSSSSIGSVKLR